jgi:hypothetical protein
MNRAQQEAFWQAGIAPLEKFIEEGGTAVQYFTGLGYFATRLDLKAGAPPDLIRQCLTAMLDALVIPPGIDLEGVKCLIQTGADAALRGIPFEALEEALKDG